MITAARPGVGTIIVRPITGTFPNDDGICHRYTPEDYLLDFSDRRAHHRRGEDRRAGTAEADRTRILRICTTP